MTSETKPAIVTTEGIAVTGGPHETAKEWAEQGARVALGREPTVPERQFVQAVALLESGYGSGWKGEGRGSWNMGAVQTRETDPAKSFAYQDSRPQPDGTSKPYTARFRKYPGPVEGMADVARILYRQMGISPTGIADVSRQMYEKHYYEGFGATKETRIANHVKALTDALMKITAATGEPMPVGGSGQMPTPKAPIPPGSFSSALDFLVQLRSVMVRDSSYASLVGDAHALVAEYQAERGLRIDGKLGPKTLGKIIDDLSVTEAEKELMHNAWLDSEAQLEKLKKDESV